MNEFDKYCEFLRKNTNVSDCFINEFIMIIGRDVEALKQVTRKYITG